MKLTQEDIVNLTKTGRMHDMPKGTYVAGFFDYYGVFNPTYELDKDFDSGIDCELCTNLSKSRDGVEFYIRFFF